MQRQEERSPSPVSPMSPFKNQEEWGPSLPKPPTHPQAQWEGWIPQSSLAASHPCAGSGSTRAHSIPGFNSPGTAIGTTGTLLIILIG